MREGRPLWEAEEAGGLIEGKCAVLMTFSESAAERDAFIANDSQLVGEAKAAGGRQVTLGLLPTSQSP